jgi:hypothetical protein
VSRRSMRRRHVAGSEPRTRHRWPPTTTSPSVRQGRGAGTATHDTSRSLTLSLLCWKIAPLASLSHEIASAGLRTETKVGNAWGSSPTNFVMHCFLMQCKHAIANKQRRFWSRPARFVSLGLGVRA